MLEQIEITKALEFISHKLSSHLTQSMNNLTIIGTNTKDKVTSLQNEMNFSLNQIIDKFNNDSLKINELYIYYNCDNKEELITALAKHVNYLRYYIKKIADLFLIYNVKYLETDSESVNSVSDNEYGINDFENIQLFLKKLDNVFEFSNGSGNSNRNDSSYWKRTNNSNNGNSNSNVMTKTFNKFSTINNNTTRSVEYNNFNTTEKFNINSNINVNNNNTFKTLNTVRYTNNTNDNNDTCVNRFTQKEYNIDTQDDNDNDNDDNNSNNNSYNSNNENELTMLLNIVNSLDTFSEFLHLTSTNPDIKDNKILSEIITRIKDLYCDNNIKSLSILFKYITDTLNIKNIYVNRIRSVFNTNEDCESIEVMATMKSLIQTYIDNLIKENTTIKSANEQLEFSLNKRTKEFEMTQKKVDMFNNKDFKTFFIEFRKENEEFIDKIPKLAKDIINKVLDESQSNYEKYENLKKEINNYKQEITYLKQKSTFNTKVSSLKGNEEYYEAFQIQMDEMKESFQEQLKEIVDVHKDEIWKLKQNIRSLENEVQYSKRLEKLLEKRLKDFEKHFTI
jgi:hypothetical protein